MTESDNCSVEGPVLECFTRKISARLLEARRNTEQKYLSGKKTTIGYQTKISILRTVGLNSAMKDPISPKLWGSLWLYADENLETQLSTNWEIQHDKIDVFQLCTISGHHVS